jgi:ATP phosphoribosyltransferase
LAPFQYHKQRLQLPVRHPHTGNTLKANGLIPLEHIEDISSRLVVNAASFKTKNAQIKTWIESIEKNL